MFFVAGIAFGLSLTGKNLASARYFVSNIIAHFFFVIISIYFAFLGISIEFINESSSAMNFHLSQIILLVTIPLFGLWDGFLLLEARGNKIEGQEESTFSLIFIFLGLTVGAMAMFSLPDFLTSNLIT